MRTIFTNAINMSNRPNLDVFVCAVLNLDDFIGDELLDWHDHGMFCLDKTPGVGAYGWAKIFLLFIDFSGILSIFKA